MLNESEDRISCTGRQREQHDQPALNKSDLETVDPDSMYT